jgi:hypothetical protein
LFDSVRHHYVDDGFPTSEISQSGSCLLDDSLNYYFCLKGTSAAFRGLSKKDISQLGGGGRFILRF